MEDVLRLMLLLCGGLAITGILVHGMWTIRKKQNDDKAPQQRLESTDWSDEIEDDYGVDDDGISAQRREPSFDDDRLTASDYDDLGLGPVRVVGRNGVASDDVVDVDTTDEDVSSTSSQPTETPASFASAEPQAPEPQEAPAAVAPPEDKPPLYASVVTQPKPEYVQEQALRAKPPVDDIPEPPPFLLKKQVDGDVVSTASEPQQTTPKTGESATHTQADAVVDDEPKSSLASQAKNLMRRKKTESERKRKEPRIREDQMRIDFDEPQAPQQRVEETQHVEAQAEVEQEVLVLNVKAPDDQPIQGAALLPMLLTLGFKFGDQNIFHRHVNSNGKGPVLFSLANMFKPGVFDIDNLETFSTQGISLFMILPIEGDPHQVFNMMHNAARKIADEFSAQVLDGRRSVLTKQSLQQYVEKIREFERLRRIAR
ncbi:cell division protein ZipA [Aestuariibacter halophilus]|uniref:Cell division protein ZipA n=1 Tax=Fluctibacter halophilus TaxID=226011 RepID=A0ABS8G417_9ALTE|nr:cell division protein ZipA [Aestuariibacter halophilus]MCC2615337.1 cell division protein ZipA [Aestuariibacter halophilus]